MHKRYGSHKKYTITSISKRFHFNNYSLSNSDYHFCFKIVPHGFTEEIV